jgi:hypothetical protein
MYHNIRTYQAHLIAFSCKNGFIISLLPAKKGTRCEGLSFQYSMAEAKADRLYITVNITRRSVACE